MATNPPPRVQRLVPYLFLEDIEAEVAFVGRAFGLEPRFMIRGDDGVVMNAEVGLGDAVVMMARSRPEQGFVSARALPGVNAGVLVYVDDVDGHFAAAKAAGARIDYAPADMPYGQREYGARDPEGNRWWFATRTRDD